MHKSRGFTLIELLVVIAIIGILSSIVMVSLNGARAKGRDARRLADLKSFEFALNLYYEANEHYPYTNCSGSNSWASFDSPTYSPNLVCDTPGGAGVTLSQKMSPYTDPLKDPGGATGDAGYLYINQGGRFDYCVLVWRTPENLNNFPPETIPASRCTAWNSSGVCTSGTNALYIGKGAYINGC